MNAELDRGRRCVDRISTMGTVVSVDVRGRPSRPDFEQAVLAVGARLRSIDELFSPWRPGSWVSRLMSAEVRLADCPAEVQRVIELAISMTARTQGCFSPFWRGEAGAWTGPDPTGLVKGWAAQQASDLLIARGLPDHVVNAAGDLVLSGDPDPAGDAAASAWRIGIGDPRRSAALVGTVELDASTSRWAVATSGVAERGLHIYDPVTGSPTETVSSATALMAVSDTNDAGAVADASATALVAAADRAPGLLDGLAREDVLGFVITRSGDLHDPHGMLMLAR